MSSLLSLLPTPKQGSKPSSSSSSSESTSKNHSEAPSSSKVKQSSSLVPHMPYTRRLQYIKEHRFVPSGDEDFNDGGAYPELNMKQYPLQMGRSAALVQHSASQHSNAVRKVDHPSQSLALQGHREDKVVYASYEDTIEKHKDEDQLKRPSDDEEKRVTQETQQAIQDKVKQRIKTAYKLSLKEQKERENQVDYVKYTPLDPISGKPSQSKIVQITEEERDPMEPSRFKNRKLPARPPSPPAPVLSAPNKKLTNEDVENWKIPPCVPNWKNKSGYVVPLDKRMGADGRDMKKTQISDRFASLAESMYNTEMTVREEIEQRKEYQRAVERKMKQQEEDQMRQLAQETRSNAISEQDLEGYRQREEIRRKVRDETLEEHRKDLLRRRKSKYMDEEEDDDRDVSERVTLGQHVVGGDTKAHRQELDSRLEQMASSDMTSGFGDDDDYNVYDKPFVNRSSESVLYRPRQENIEAFHGDVEDDSQSVKKRFTRAGLGAAQGEAREGGTAVSFQKEEKQGRQKDEQRGKQRDEFAFLTGATSGERSKKRSMDHIGKGGFMRAAGGASNDVNHYRAAKRRKIGFSKSSTQK